MTEPVKRDLRHARRAATEARLIDAATAMFLDHGYAATKMTDVAERAGIAARTVYLRFETKADLLERCVSVAIAGDAEPVSIRDRDWMTDAMTASTLTQRIHLMASVTAALMDRAGSLLEVAHQAAATEPTIAAAVEAGREDTARTLGAFWHRIADDGLLPPHCDIDWLADTATLLAHAETYLLLTKTTGWDIPTYQAWLETTWHRLVQAGTPAIRRTRERR